MRQQPLWSLLARFVWVPYFVLLTALLATAGAGLYVTRMERAAAQLSFENQVQQTQDAIFARLETYISSLRGVSGLFAADPGVDREAFRAYVDRLDLAQHYPGIQGIGFSLRVAPADLPGVVARMRAQGLPDFHVWPAGDRPELHTIIYLEPRDRRNLAALGFDMFSEPVRRAAMEQARDTGAPAASGRVTLVQEIDPNKQPGFLIYVPVYRGGHVPATVGERRARLNGFAYSPFRAGDLLEGILGAQNPSIAFELYDGPAPAPASLLYASAPADLTAHRPTYTTTRTITVAGRTWTLAYRSLPAFERSGTRYLVPFILLTGLLVSIILFAVMRTQVVARTEAEDAVRVRDVFLSVASHELKTPLTALLGNAQLLQRRLARGDAVSERDRRVVRTIVEQLQRLTRLIGALLDHSRIQSGRLSIAPAPLDLAALVRRVVDDVRPTLVDHAIELSLPDVPLPILGDELPLDQVLQNLLGNAVKYSPAGGPIAVSAERQGDWALVRVADRGLGIPAEALPHLFQPFYRAPNVDGRRISGLGIGLFLTREIIAQHGGEVTVASEEGQGSTFTIQLPLADSSPVPHDSIADQPGAQPNLTR